MLEAVQLAHKMMWANHNFISPGIFGFHISEHGSIITKPRSQTIKMGGMSADIHFML
jgi:Cu/Zn superoxide dismutase